MFSVSCDSRAGSTRAAHPAAQPTAKQHTHASYWTRKVRGRTVSLLLTEDELVLYREWIENNRKLERLVKEMRHVSSRVLALITGREVP